MERIKNKSPFFKRIIVWKYEKSKIKANKIKSDVISYEEGNELYIKKLNYPRDE